MEELREREILIGPFAGRGVTSSGFSSGSVSRGVGIITKGAARGFFNGRGLAGKHSRIHPLHSPLHKLAQLARSKQRLAPDEGHDVDAFGLQFHQAPDVFGHTEDVDWFSAHFFDDPGAFGLVAYFPVFFLAVGGAVLDDFTVRTAEEGDVFVSGFFLAEAAAVHFGELT